MVISLADQIEGHLVHLLQRSNGDTVEVRRADLAGRFECVPSQINYVLETRFSLERGYLVESRRGGGGFIRIIRVRYESPSHLVREVFAAIGDQLDEQRALHYVQLLLDRGVIQQGEAAIIAATVRRDTLRLPLPSRDRLRARLFRAALLSVLRDRAREVT